MQASQLPDFFVTRGVLWLAMALISACASSPEPRQAGNYPPMVNYALSLQGKPYQYGKDSPDEGFDCSGFVKHVYGHQGIPLPRTAEGMANALSEVPKNELRPGDLVFFNTNGRPFSHVGIYVSGNDFIHAPSRNTGKVQISNLKDPYWWGHFSCARRP